MTIPDMFIKVSVVDRYVLVRDRTGKPILTCHAQDGFRAVKRLGAFIDTVLEERSACASASSTSPAITTETPSA